MRKRKYQARKTGKRWNCGTERITGKRRKCSGSWRDKKYEKLRVLEEEADEEGEIKGRRNGKKESILDLLEEISPVPEDLRGKILTQEDEDILKKWLKLAARAENIEMFSKQIS